MLARFPTACQHNPPVADPMSARADSFCLRTSPSRFATTIAGVMAAFLLAQRYRSPARAGLASDSGAKKSHRQPFQGQARESRQVHGSTAGCATDEPPARKKGRDDTHPPTRRRDHDAGGPRRNERTSHRLRGIRSALEPGGIRTGACSDRPSADGREDEHSSGAAGPKTSEAAQAPRIASRPTPRMKEALATTIPTPRLLIMTDLLFALVLRSRCSEDRSKRVSR